MQQLVKHVGFIMVLGMFLSFGIEAQSTVKTSPSVESLMTRFIEYNRTAEVPGWRLMISLSRDRRGIEEARIRFQNAFPKFVCQLEYKDPYYKLMAFAFTNKFDVKVALNEVRQVFPGATEVIAPVTNEAVYENRLVQRP